MSNLETPELRHLYGELQDMGRDDLMALKSDTELAVMVNTAGVAFGAGVTLGSAIGLARLTRRIERGENVSRRFGVVGLAVGLGLTMSSLYVLNKSRQALEMIDKKLQ